MKNALLVIDVQQFYTPNLPRDFALKIANHYQALSYDEVIFSVFQNSAESNFVRSLKWTKCSTNEDAELPAELQPMASDNNVFKRATYSAFKADGLHEHLQSKQVDRLVVCGVDVDACVLATAFEAFDLGYHVKVEFGLTYSGNNLQAEAEKIIQKNIISRD